LDVGDFPSFVALLLSSPRLTHAPGCPFPLLMHTFTHIQLHLAAEGVCSLSRVRASDSLDFAASQDIETGKQDRNLYRDMHYYSLCLDTFEIGGSCASVAVMAARLVDMDPDLPKIDSQSMLEVSWAYIWGPQKYTPPPGLGLEKIRKWLV